MFVKDIYVEKQKYMKQVKLDKQIVRDSVKQALKEIAIEQRGPVDVSATWVANSIADRIIYKLSLWQEN